jgi:hypothetical protein
MALRPAARDGLQLELFRQPPAHLGAQSASPSVWVDPRPEQPGVDFLPEEEVAARARLGLERVRFERAFMHVMAALERAPSVLRDRTFTVYAKATSPAEADAQGVDFAVTTLDTRVLAFFAAHLGDRLTRGFEPGLVAMDGPEGLRPAMRWVRGAVVVYRDQAAPAERCPLPGGGEVWAHVRVARAVSTLGRKRGLFGASR